MAGRKPRELYLNPADRRKLEMEYRKGSLSQRVARRVRILLEMDRGINVGLLAQMVDMDPASIWRVCRRYEERGLNAIYDAPRPGRKRLVSDRRGQAQG